MQRNEIQFKRPTFIRHDGRLIDYHVDFDTKTIEIRDGLEGGEFLAVLDIALEVAEREEEFSESLLTYRPSSRHPEA